MSKLKGQSKSSTQRKMHSLIKKRKKELKHSTYAEEKQTSEKTNQKLEGRHY